MPATARRVCSSTSTAISAAPVGGLGNLGEASRGRASRLRDDVERRHHEAGAVSKDADVAVELDVLQAFFARAPLERVSLILIGEGLVLGVAEEGVAVE